MQEIEKHVTKDDAWIVLFGEAIDVTKFIPLHPGGEDLITKYLGKDATEDWQLIHTAATLESQLQHLRKMGRVQADAGLLGWLWERMTTRGGWQNLRLRDGPHQPEQQPPQQPQQQPQPQQQRKEQQQQSPRGEPAKAETPEEEDTRGIQWTAEHEAELPPGGIFDLSELSRWDGVQLPMCIGICGLVVDVSSSENFVPNFGYGKIWAGKDTTWSMATVSLKDYDANCFDFKVEDLDSQQMTALAGWFMHFTKKYRTVGTLREYKNWDFGLVHKAVAELPS